MIERFNDTDVEGTSDAELHWQAIAIQLENITGPVVPKW
jgi:hypothetical protein